MVSRSRLGRKVVRLHRRRLRRDRASVMRSQPRLSGRHGIATIVQPGKSCIGSPVFSRAAGEELDTARPGESSSGRVLTNSPIGAGPGHQRAALAPADTPAPAYSLAQPAVIDLVHRVGVAAAVDDARRRYGPAGSRRRPAGRAPPRCRADCSSAPGPMPDSCSNLRRVDRRRRTAAPRAAPCARCSTPFWLYSTPTARLPSSSTRWASARISTRRLGRCIAGRR